MITFTCNEANCPNKEIDYNFFGNDNTAECGGCKAVLIGTNERPDPELPETNPGTYAE
jgi:hypothetical protein